jgi:hypothetical protein
MLQVANHHSFHIPVMGTAFTIDTPLRVARYGISSCISLGDDGMIEQMRRIWSERLGHEYQPISARSEDARARRLTAYLDFLHARVEEQIHALRQLPFHAGSDLDTYFELLPEGPLKQAYTRMAQAQGEERLKLEALCREAVLPGAIEVNIMTKVNRDRFWRGQKLGPEMGDALSGLRGFARSKGRASVVFSAGMNPRLYAYAGEFESFLPEEGGSFAKGIVLKVSDFRSALVQGQFLAKKGLWVSEFRVESGLNCGGHAFAKDGMLLGPILQEFLDQRQSLTEQLFEQLSRALSKRGWPVPTAAPRLRVTAQGGIGTAEEDRFLRTYYSLDRTGWGTPFLLVPEATIVDAEHLQLLQEAGEEDVQLSQSSPFGIPFWTLRGSASERARLARIEAGRSGSLCPKGYLAFSTEFSERPLCLASARYQDFKREQILSAALNAEERQAHLQEMEAKACICHDLAGAADRSFGLDPTAEPAICPGPNIANFSRIASLKEMVAHIYGRLNLITRSDRPHMFVREGRINLDYLREEIRRFGLKLSSHSPKSLAEIRDNLLQGLQYYHGLACSFIEPLREPFLQEIQRLCHELETLSLPVEAHV